MSTASRKPPGFFRGREAPLWLVLLGLMIGGWAVVAAVVFGLNSRRDERPAPRLAAVSPLPPADPAPELQGILDRGALTPRDNPGYLLLLERVRNTTPEALRAAARRDVAYSQILENPTRYRGLPIHVEGTTLRVLQQQTEGSVLFPKGSFFEAFVVTPDSGKYLWNLAFEDAPANLPIGASVRIPIAFDGYFLKLWAYTATEKSYVAPLLVGRIRWLEPNEGTKPAAGGGWPIDPWWTLALGALLVFGLMRWMIFSRRAFTRRSRPLPRGTMPVSDQIDADDLQAWVEGQREGGEQSGPVGGNGKQGTLPRDDEPAP